LDISHINGISDKTMRCLAKYAKNILKLELSGCVQVTSSGLTELCESCTKLKELQFNGCTKIMDVGMCAVGANLHNLEILCLRSCEYISDNSLYLLADGCTKLRGLDISCVDLASIVVVNEIIKKCPYLTQLNCESCNLTFSEYSRSVESNIPLSRVNGVRCQLQSRLRPIFEYNTYVTHMVQKNKQMRIIEKFVKYVVCTRWMRMAARQRRKAVQNIRRLYIEYLTRKRRVGRKRNKKVRLICARYIQAWSRRTLGRIAAVRKTQLLRRDQLSRITIQRYLFI
jgi:hypothetical protein